MVTYIGMPLPELEVWAFLPDEFEDCAKHPDKARGVPLHSVPELVHWRDATSIKKMYASMLTTTSMAPRMAAIA